MITTTAPAFALRLVEVHVPDHGHRSVWRVVHAATGNPVIDARGVLESGDRDDARVWMESLNEGLDTDYLPDTADYAPVDVQADEYETIAIGDALPGEQIVWFGRRRAQRRVATVRRADVRRGCAGPYAASVLKGVLHIDDQAAPVFVDPNQRLRLARPVHRVHQLAD